MERCGKKANKRKAKTKRKKFGLGWKNTSVNQKKRHKGKGKAPGEGTSKEAAPQASDFLLSIFVEICTVTHPPGGDSDWFSKFGQ